MTGILKSLVAKAYNEAPLSMFPDFVRAEYYGTS